MPPIKKHNLFSGLPAAQKREVFRPLQKGKGFKIERIVSSGQSTPKGKWFYSKMAEWVIVLKGRARLRFEGKPESFAMKTGDYVFIPAKTRHRVEWTPAGQKTVWLAVHVK
jgi:cupin 2 domain-containing protein